MEKCLSLNSLNWWVFKFSVYHFGVYVAVKLLVKKFTFFNVIWIRIYKFGYINFDTWIWIDKIGYISLDTQFFIKYQFGYTSSGYLNLDINLGYLNFDR